MEVEEADGSSAGAGAAGPSEAAIAARRDVIAQPLRRRGGAVLGTRRRQVFAGVVIFAAIGFLVAEGLANATVYFKTVSQAVADKASLGTSAFRIEGTVGPKVTQDGQTVRFNLSSNGVTVPIVDTGDPPQLFKPGIPVVLEGHWQGAVYASDQIMVKHTASYVEAHPNRVKGDPAGATVPDGSSVSK